MVDEWVPENKARIPTMRIESMVNFFFFFSLWNKMSILTVIHLLLRLVYCILYTTQLLFFFIFSRFLFLFFFDFVIWLNHTCCAFKQKEKETKRNIFNFLEFSFPLKNDMQSNLWRTVKVRVCVHISRMK